MGIIKAAHGIIGSLATAWQMADPLRFAEHFTEDGLFVAFDGSLHRGREAIAAFHAQAFQTVLKASLLELRVADVRQIACDAIFVTTHGGVVFPFDPIRSRAQKSVQTMSLVDWSDRPRVACLHNTRFRPITDDRSAVTWQNFDSEWESISTLR